MALKNLFDMAKADKYTADGREAIIKAQEEETEDKVYQIGEISQKTGLQKTANGWVKPKNGKQPGAKKKEEPKNVHGAEVDKIYERQLKRIKELKAKGFTDEQIDNDKIIKQTKEDMKNVGKKPESKPAEKLPAKPTRGMSESYIRGTQLMKPAEDESQRGEQHWAGVLSGYDNTSVIEQRKQLQEKYDEFEEDIKDYDRRGLAPAVYAKRINQQNFIKGALKAIDDEMENRGMDPAPRTSVPDAAPRILTGDTRIRVRKA